jgi:hypothetical protein
MQNPKPADSTEADVWNLFSDGTVGGGDCLKVESVGAAPDHLLPVEERMLVTKPHVIVADELTSCMSWPDKIKAGRDNTIVHATVDGRKLHGRAQAGAADQQLRLGHFRCSFEPKHVAPLATTRSIPDLRDDFGYDEKGAHLAVHFAVVAHCALAWRAECVTQMGWKMIDDKVTPEENEASEALHSELETSLEKAMCPPDGH